MTLGFVQPSDEARIYQLLQEVGLPTSDLTSGHFEHFLAMKDGAALLGVVGVERLSAHRGLLRSLAVKPEYRGKRIGAELLEAAENHACSMGMREIYALTTTIEPWLTRLGFERSDRETLPEDVRATSEFRSLCPSSAATMRKTLRVPAEGKPYHFVCA